MHLFEINQNISFYNKTGLDVSKNHCRDYNKAYIFTN